jgi:uncharacterized protein
MQATREIILSHPALALAVIGLVIGGLFGAIASAANFCVMGALSDWRAFGDLRRLGTVALAAATAIAGTQALHLTGTIDLKHSMYLAHRINWLGAAGGGLIFGAGMVLAGGCASRNLVRAGGGDMRALVTILALSLAAFATISGVLGPLRNGLETSTAIEAGALGMSGPSLADLGARLGLSISAARLCAISLMLLPLLWFAFGVARVHTSALNTAAGIGIGLLVVTGWLVTGLAYDEMAVRPVMPTSLSFVRPVGDALDWLEHSTALGLPNFGAATVFGTLAGSFLNSARQGRLRVSGFRDTDDLGRHLGGAALMGFGGVLGLGCSIGQGITGLSTLAIQSLITSAAIVAGAILALGWLERRV